MDCPFCNSNNTVKAGPTTRVRPTPHILQQYKCKSCFRTFAGEEIPITTQSQEVVGNNPDPSPLSSDIPVNIQTKNDILLSVEQPKCD